MVVLVRFMYLKFEHPNDIGCPFILLIDLHLLQEFYIPKDIHINLT
jgi:hypothetical protein